MKKRAIMGFFSKKETVNNNKEKTSSPDRTITASVAKWLIPSVSALFVIIGYIDFRMHLGTKTRGCLLGMRTFCQRIET